jgi:hypothetical protein
VIAITKMRFSRLKWAALFASRRAWGMIVQAVSDGTEAATPSRALKDSANVSITVSSRQVAR